MSEMRDEDCGGVGVRQADSRQRIMSRPVSELKITAHATVFWQACSSAFSSELVEKKRAMTELG